MLETLSRLFSAGGFFTGLSLGAAGERAAAKFLKRKGYKIIQANHRQRRGEIDLVAVEGHTIVFVEVKTWRSGAAADPSEAVDLKKRRFLTRAAKIYLKRRKLMDRVCRFDVISVVWGEEDQRQGKPPTIRHFEHAFEATE